MDALILSCGTGGGHDSAGRAVEQELLARGHHVTLLDPYTLRGERTSHNVNNAYISLAQRVPSAFGAVYALGNAVRRLPGRSPVYYINRAMAPILEKYLLAHPCDAIIMPHLFPAEIVTNMKRRGMAVPATFFVATDYACIPFTEETDCDYYITPAPEFTAEFVSRGIPEERIVPLGIPVRREFTAGGSQAASRELLGLEDGLRHILVAGGSIGAGHLDASVRALTGHFGDSARITVICGSNKPLYEKLTKELGGTCEIISFTPHIADYMRCADIFISKPGGLSSTEAAAVGTALIHITPIPGCETRNMEFFARNGLCIPVTNPRTELAEACDRLLAGSARAEMIQRQHSVLPRNAAANICDLIESACAGVH